jgi:polyhydroxybutyrate depolymerase
MGDTARHLLSYGDKQRQYLLFTPTSYSGEPMALAVVLHARGSDGENIAETSGFSHIAEESGFLVAYPEAYEGTWDRDADVGFVRAVVDAIAHKVSVDPARLYLIGYSQGAGLANQIAGDWHNGIAAFADVSHVLSKGHAKILESAGPVPAVFMHGTSDPVSPHQGTKIRQTNRQSRLSVADRLSAMETATFWASKNGDVALRTAELPLKLDDGRTYTGAVHTWTRKGVLLRWPVVKLYSLERGGHPFPSSEPAPFHSDRGHTVVEIADVSQHPGARLIYDFLKMQRKSSWRSG